MPFINPWMLLTTAIALALAGAGGFRLGMDHAKAQELAQLTQAIDAQKQAQEEAAKISAGYEQVVAYQNDIQKSFEKRWRDALDKPVYRDCRPDADGLHALRDEFAASNTARGLAYSMPSLKATAGGSGHGGLDDRSAGLGARLQHLLSAPGRTDSVSQGEQ